MAKIRKTKSSSDVMAISSSLFRLSFINYFLPLYSSIFPLLCVSSLTRVRDLSHTCGEHLAHVCDKFFIRTKREFMSLRADSFVLMKRLIGNEVF
jgi:hypothetical protein